MQKIYKVGAPRKIKDEKELTKHINNYIDSCFSTKINEDGTETTINTRPITMRGFAVYLGIAYETLMDWERNREELAEPIRELRGIVHSFLENCLYDNKRPQVGIIFALKNNFKEHWKDKTEVESINTNINKTLPINFIDKEDITEE